MDTGMIMVTNTNGTSHPRACATCARAKVKCVPNQTLGEQCHRCHRLNKTCESAVQSQESRGRKDNSRVRKTRVAKLEEKLEGLVTLLKSRQENVLPSEGQSSISITSADRSPTIVPLPNEQIPIEEEPLSNSSFPQQVPIPSSVWVPFPVTGSSLSLKAFSSVEPWEDEEELLQLFRSVISPKFPFIYLPDTANAHELRRDRPYFFTAIIAASTRNSTKQKEAWKWLIEQLSERMFQNSERSIDLLLGVLTYLSWGGNHFFNVPRFTSLIAATSILVADMGLNRPVLTDSVGPFRAAIRKSCGFSANTYTERTTEDRRALLACYVLQSTVSQYFQRIDPPRLTPYKEECCQVLSDLGEHPRDSYAVLLFRLQVIVERISSSPWHGSFTSIGEVAPPTLFVKSVEQQLDALKTQFPPDPTHHPKMSSKPFLLLGYYYAKTQLYKISISSSPELPVERRDFDRLSLLYSCLQAVSDFMDIWLAIPAVDYPSIPMSAYAQMTNELGLLQLLSTFEHPDWNLPWVREKISFTSIIERVAERMEQVRDAVGYDQHTTEQLDMFSEGSRRLSWVKSYFEGKITVIVPPSQDQSDAQLLQDPTIFEHESAAAMGDPMNMNYLDDIWLQDIFGPFDYHSTM